MNDSYNSNNGIYYTVDAQFAYSTDGRNWSEFFDDETSSISVSGGSTLYFCVKPYFEGKMGTYLLNIGITVGVGIDEFDETSVCVYPNPVKGCLNVNCGESNRICLYNALGVLFKSLDTEGKDSVQLDMSDLPSGTYFLQVLGNRNAITKKVIKIE